ncbi:MAG TPA: hypothetical protein EYM37_08550 [Methylophaga aminisulfidivorans]|uniref:Uncharacterized protein n=1 Tax=Methylophaga aminisulfidivorans MP TaxID=1026882 RepID=F5T1E3_9GAMM|nr:MULTISPECIES: hypothetical protein [Methylophaga]EGL53029.1 hypothetical protein MAMP_00082 [Methylophaga aminisulfidivorans MP]WVI84509.1 hypothetical protein VSX76_12075 [Methylophaga thalassica]HIC45135.1 hypothetical protein [Methylophaga sp.]HIM39977.1 hypothetical protein [Methylophaga aminisulfidivorans]
MQRLSIFLCLVLIFSSKTNALTLPPVPSEPIYFEPPVVTADQKMQDMSCYQVDKAINQLHPYRYTYKPTFYKDDANKAATALVMIDTIPIVQGWLGLGYLGYSALVEEKEDRRQLQVEQQISALQRIKAEKHCYE